MPKKSEKPRPPVQAPPPSEPPRRRSILPFAGIVAVLAIVAVYHFYGRPNAPAEPVAPAASADTAPQQAQPAKGPLQVPAATEASNEEPAAAKFGPHKQDAYPPLPETGFPPPRPMETVKAVYQFAAEHPEVLGYIPCYCGCDRQGHKGNDDCFVAQRNAKGDVESWDSHGMTWAVCIDIARDAMQMYASGASVRDIRMATEKKWGAQFPTTMHTPMPPATK